MPWVCIKDVVAQFVGFDLYDVQICGFDQMSMYGPPGMPIGNCAAPNYPACVQFGDDAATLEFLKKQTILRHPDLTEEQHKQIDRIADKIAYQRMNEPDANVRQGSKDKGKS